ncbi:MAG: hypothetical protein PF488_01780 [Patescibacteria group bacterium]|jgi:hypothetical protein|nr:hypothetical protein [Patescibacteria group bacterium]
MKDDNFEQDNKGDRAEEREGIENWLNNHGQPNFDFLKSLIKDGSEDSLRQLKSIANDLDVDYHSNISAYDLVDKIMLASNQQN